MHARQSRRSRSCMRSTQPSGCVGAVHKSLTIQQLLACRAVPSRHASACGRPRSTNEAPGNTSAHSSIETAEVAHFAHTVKPHQQLARTRHARAWVCSGVEACIGHVQPNSRVCSHYPQSQPHFELRRGILLGSAVAAGTIASWAVTGSAVTGWGAAHASKLPAFADRAWEALGGGPSDLTFPESFLGVWDVTSVLTQVELPLGEEMAADIKVVQRAQQEDLNRPIRYQVAFVRNREDNVVYDRAFNTAAMLSYYYGRPAADFLTRITWNKSDPNILELNMPGGMFIRTRVTRRSEQRPSADRIETSEYIEQVFDSSSMSESSGPAPRLKASQCFTKYKFRDERGVPAGQPAIVATQVVSDYLDPRTDDPRAIQALNRPVTLYTYKLAFTRAAAV